MYQVELMQIRGDRKSMFLRGRCGALPQPGRTFGLMFEDDESPAVLHTTTVLSVDETDEAIEFQTLNSAYLLRFVEKPQ